MIKKWKLISKPEEKLYLRWYKFGIIKAVNGNRNPSAKEMTDVLD